MLEVNLWDSMWGIEGQRRSALPAEGGGVGDRRIAIANGIDDGVYKILHPVGVAVAGNAKYVEQRLRMVLEGIMTRVLSLSWLREHQAPATFWAISPPGM